MLILKEEENRICRKEKVQLSNRAEGMEHRA